MSKLDWLWLACASAGLLLAGLGLGRYVWPCREGMERELDDAYDDGRADQRKHDLAEIARLEHDVAWLESQRGYDALHPTYEVLSPAALDAANDLPGPGEDRANARDRGIGGTENRAGESHEPPLPAILQLGQEGDGTDRTFTRVRLRQMTMLTEFDREQAALMASCGLTYRGLVAA